MKPPRQSVSLPAKRPIIHSPLAIVLAIVSLPFLVAATKSKNDPHGPNWQDDDSQVLASDGWQKTVLPLLTDYCLDCHTGEDAEGSLDLSVFDELELAVDQKRLWKMVAERVRTGVMPPPDASPLPDDSKQQLLSFLDNVLPTVACNHESHAAEVSIRRLTRLEYFNTIRDLLGVESQALQEFPRDEVGYGFDNIGDVLSTSTLLFEKYLDQAEYISQQAIVDLRKKQVDLVIDAADFETTRGSRAVPPGHFMTTSGTITHDIDVPADGKYEITITAFGTHAGDDWVEMGLSVGGREVDSDTVESERDEPSSHRFVERLRKGRNEIGISFKNDYYDPDFPVRNRRDRNLAVIDVAIKGPTGDPQSSLPESHKRILFEQPRDGVTKEQAAEAIISLYASKAFRRKVTPEETQKLLQVFQQASDTGESFEGAMQVVLQAILVSPHFLFKIETPTAPDTVRSLSEFELATAISYFIWSSMPDDRLFRLAAEGKLSQPNVLSAELDRMLADQKASSLVDNFVEQWLQLRVIEQIDPDPDLFPTFDSSLRESMIGETKHFIADVIWSDRPLTDLLLADYSFLNARMAEHYGVPVDQLSPDRFEKVNMAEHGRQGLLSHASILTLTSNPTRTSPVKRGKWVLENLLAEPPPPAIPDVPTLDSQKQLTGTLREKMEQHRIDPNCAPCHKKMDGIGFALENFDAIGKYRTMDEGRVIDDSGTLPGGISFTGSRELQQVIAKEKKYEFVRCICEKLFIFATGRGPRPKDECVIDSIATDAMENDSTFAEIVKAIVTSQAFTQRRGIGENQ